ncbi:MAG: hypothetical protein ABJB10_06570, partial [Mesorhizobium sp.]
KVDQVQMGVDDHDALCSLAISSHRTEKFFIQTGIRFEQPIARAFRRDRSQRGDHLRRRPPRQAEPSWSPEPCR